MTHNSSCTTRPHLDHLDTNSTAMADPSLVDRVPEVPADQSRELAAPLSPILKRRPSNLEISPSVDFMAAGLVSALSKILVYPMETRVLLMAVGDVDMVRVGQLWHGVVVKGLENFLYNGLLWYLKERVRPIARDPSRPEDRLPASFTAAFCVSCVAVLVVHPLSNLVVGMQGSLRNPARKPASALEVVHSIMKSDGVGGFWKGWRFSLILRIGSASTFTVYEFVRRRLAAIVGSDASNLLAGTLGRMSEVYTCHPIRTLRSRQQQGQRLMESGKMGSLLGLWSGVGTMATADALKIGLRFCLIERLRKLLQSMLNWIHKPKQKQVKFSHASGEVAKIRDVAMGA